MASSGDDSIMINVTDKKVDVTETIKLFKEQYCATKKHYRSLSNILIVYGREEVDCDESVVARDVYPNAKFNGSGIAGIAKIKKLFDAIIQLVFEQKDRLLQSCKYGLTEILELTNMAVVQQLLLSKFKEDGTYVDNGDRCISNSMTSEFTYGSPKLVN